MKKVFGQIGKLKPSCIAEYTYLHEVAVFTPQWAGILSMIQECNIQNYSIFIEDDIVFSYFEYTGGNYQEDMEKMAADPLTQQWWTHTKPCFIKYKTTSRSDFYSDMKQIFHLP